MKKAEYDKLICFEQGDKFCGVDFALELCRNKFVEVVSSDKIRTACGLLCGALQLPVKCSVRICGGYTMLAQLRCLRHLVPPALCQMYGA